MPEIETDEALMLRYQSGDAAAFDSLYERHRSGLYRTLSRQCRSREHCDELFQEVWMNVIQSSATWRAEAQFRTWLYTLAHHRLIDHFRRQGRGEMTGVEDDIAASETIIGSRTDQPDIQAQAQQQGHAIVRALDALPEVQREAFLLHEEGGLSVEEIASATGVTFEAAKSRLRYAINKLRGALREVA